MADSASAPAPAAPATAGERRRPTAAPGPIELSDEKTVQTLATHGTAARRADAARRRVARVRAAAGHGAGRAARDAAELPALQLRGLGDRRLVAEPRRRRLHRLAAVRPLPPLQVSTTSLPRLMPPQNSDWSAANALGTSIWHQQHGRTLRPL